MKFKFQPFLAELNSFFVWKSSVAVNQSLSSELLHGSATTSHRLYLSLAVSVCIVCPIVCAEAYQHTGSSVDTIHPSEKSTHLGRTENTGSMKPKTE